MARRLIYNPKAWVYVKNAKNEILDLTTYVTGGKVNRLINQVSTAEVRLRNPNKIFTTPARGVAFHPMDPITIFLQRHHGIPVRVFTGYLDRTPYYQMFPGTITLKASCTLKKLLYTFFDPSLPYVFEWMKKYGWAPYQDGVMLSSEAAKETGKGNIHKPFTKGGSSSLNDGGIGSLLYGALTEISEWPDHKILIERIPNDVIELMHKLMENADAESKVREKELEEYLKEIIGVSSYGSGGGSGTATPTGNLKDLKKIIPTMERVANEYKLPPAFVISTSYNECTLNPNAVGSEGATGWFAFNFKFEFSKPDQPYAGKGNDKSYTLEEARDTGIATAAFCQAAAWEASQNPSYRSESKWEEWATATQGSIGYPHWSENMPTIRKWLSEYGGGSLNPGESISKGEFPSIEETEEGSTNKGKKKSPEKLDHYHAIIAAANNMAEKKYPYVWGGGHGSNLKPSAGEGEAPLGSGYDCSGAVSAILYEAGYEIPLAGMSSGQFANWGESGPNEEVTIYANSDHVFLKVGGKYFASLTKGENTSATNIGPRWFNTAAEAGGAEPSSNGEVSGFTATHPAGLNQPANVRINGGGNNTEVPGGTGANSPNENMMSAALATAFTGEIEWPSLESMLEAAALTGQRSLMNDKPIMPFIQQLSQGSLRSFMSLPNGDFFGFYPDYFGEFGVREPYWYIEDVEILDGGIEVTDDNLATHVYAIGDQTFPANDELINKMLSAGVINIFNAFEGEIGITDRKLANARHDKKEKGVSDAGIRNALDREEAISFMQRYGARPVVLEFPMIRNPVFEMLMAYQNFMLAWSRQFLTPFTFTFMPEIYPGGKVGFPNHGLQMYIESVTHEWDLETGFTTTAQLTAPSLLKGHSALYEPSLPPNMVSALSEPLKQPKKGAPRVIGTTSQPNSR